MKKKLLVLTSLFASTAMLGACGNLGKATSGGGASQTVTSKKKGYQTTGQTDTDYYQGIIKDGRYLTNKARGVGVYQNSDNMLNLKSFEAGLTNLSKEQFPTKSYVFREGQILSKDTVENWLDRKTKDNPDGLNPEDNGKKEADKRNPIYVQQIEEQDYMQEKDGKLSLAGVTIGIGMNQKDYYQKEEYGATYTTDISTEKMKEEGQKAAATILARLRQKSEIGNDTPILICMFKQAPNDSLVGGSFYAYALSKNGTSISSWTDTDIKSVVLPATDSSSVPNENDATSFSAFMNKTQSFFPNLAGVTAQAQYKGKELQGMHVNITTQFYSMTEITSFTQFVSQMARTYLPSGVPVDITIKGSDGTVQAFLSRDSGQNSYYTHVFNSY